MKKTIAIILALLPSITASFSQPVFPESDAIWNYHQYHNGSLQEWIYGLSGDTVISGLTYSKLYLLNDTTLVIDEADRYLGGFRQDDKKVWFRPVGVNSEWIDLNRDFLLFDFGKNVDEEIFYDYVHYQSVTEPDFYGDMIAADIIFTDYYTPISDIEETAWGRKFTINGWQVFLEGVGSLGGMYGWVFAYPTCCGENYSVKLGCFKHHNEIKYLDPDCDVCFSQQLGGTTPEELFDKESVQVSFDGNCVEVTAKHSVLPFTFELIDTKGQILRRQLIYSEYSQVPCDKSGEVLLYCIKDKNLVLKTGKIITKNQ